MSRYVLGLRKAGGQTDHATSYATASKTVEEVNAWRANGGAVTVILRAGKPIDDKCLLREAEKEQRPKDKLRRKGISAIKISEF